MDYSTFPKRTAVIDANILKVNTDKLINELCIYISIITIMINIITKVTSNIAEPAINHST